MNLTKYLLEISNFDPIKLNYFLSLSITDFHEHLVLMKAETSRRQKKSGKGINA